MLARLAVGRAACFLAQQLDRAGPQPPAATRVWQLVPAAVSCAVTCAKANARSSTKGVGSTSCSAAQASFSSLEKQQQCFLQSAASWQPQRRSMQGNATLRSLPDPLGNG